MDATTTPSPADNSAPVAPANPVRNAEPEPTPTDSSSNSNKIKQIFFDCDNTLINTEEISFEAAAPVINKVMADQGFGVRYTNEELIDLFFALTARQMITELQKMYDFTLTPSQIAEYTQYEEDIVVELLLARPNPCPGVEAVLKKLKQSNKYQLAVVSSSPIKRIRAALVAGGIAQYFDEEHVYSAKSSMPEAKSKPDPAIYQRAMEKNGVIPEECVAFEDSRSGARSSISAGITTVAYVGAYATEDQREQVAKTLMEEGCAVVMKDYAQFFDCLTVVENMK